MRNLSDAVKQVMALASHEGLHKTPLPWLTLVRSDKPTTLEMVLYEPSVCIVLQGKKETRQEHTTFYSHAANCILGAVNLPVLGAVIEASPSEPYLCLRIDIDSSIIAELVDEHDLSGSAPNADSAMTLGAVDENMIDTVSRLLDSLESEATARALAPLIQKELYWRLLQQIPARVLLSQLAKDSKYYALYKVINWLETNFSQQVTMDDLANQAAMSLSSFYAHFKAATGISPLQYRNRLRLIKARKLMLLQGCNAAEAGFAVGYQEPAQFNREYSRLFGLPPKRDLFRLKSHSLAEFV